MKKKIFSTPLVLLLALTSYSQGDCAKMPVEKGTIGSLYGYRTHPITYEKKLHTGIDIRAKSGTSVFSAFDGVVLETKKSSKGYGNSIKVLHDNGLITLYAHLSAFTIKEGDIVCKGTIIGKVGNSGASVGPHLHFEIIENKKKINPLVYML